MAPNQAFFFIGVALQFAFGMGMFYLAWFAHNAQPGNQGGAGPAATWFQRVLVFVPITLGVAAIGYGIWSLFHIPAPQLPG